jgi:parvulin-like peptidyl-prolyl isomerase
LKKSLKLALTTMLFMGIGVVVWKFFSTPIPSANLDLADEPANENTAQTNSTFQTIVVGSTTITAEDFQWELGIQLNSPGLDSAPEFATAGASDAPPPTTNEPSEKIAETQGLQEQAMTAVIERKILYQYIASPAISFDLSNPGLFTACLEALNETIASGGSYFASPQSKERLKAKLCEQSVIEQYLEQKVLSSITISPSEIASYYRLHEKDFNRPLRMFFRQIVFADEATAKEIRHKIKKTNFAQLALQHSIAPEASKGGLIGPFSREQLPSLFDSAYAMEIGEITGVIKSDYGFHIIMPSERIPAHHETISAATPKIRADILRTKRLRAYQNFLNKAMNVISVTSPNSGVF